MTGTLIVLALSGANAHSQERDLKERGGQAMRVDQDQAAHVFDALPDGGRIELQATDDDRVAIDGIREHFKEIETVLMFVHDECEAIDRFLDARRG